MRYFLVECIAIMLRSILKIFFTIPKNYNKERNYVREKANINILKLIVLCYCGECWRPSDAGRGLQRDVVYLG
jgi:hypothetical protein